MTKGRMASEHLEQVRTVAWFRKTFPIVWIFAIPNGEKRSASTGARLKAEGVSAGVPDLFVPSWCLWVEMKTATGKLSPAQKHWIAYLESIGHHVLVCYGFEDAKEQIKRFSENFYQNA